MADKRNNLKRVCALVLCVLPLILSGCRTAPAGAADTTLSGDTGQTQQDAWQGTDTTEYSPAQDDPAGDTSGTPVDPVDTTQTPTESSATQGSTEPPATQTPTEPPATETTVPGETQPPSDPPLASDNEPEDVDTTQQQTTEETVNMGDESVPANTESGWGPIQ